MTKEVFVDIVYVEIEREPRAPRARLQEAVGTKTLINGMPGRADSRKLWNDSVRARGDVRTTLDQVRAMSEQIQRPRTTRSRRPAWEEPKEMRDRWMAGNDPALINKLKSELTAAREQLKAAEDELARLPVPGAAPKDGGRPPVPPPPGRSGGATNRRRWRTPSAESSGAAEGPRSAPQRLNAQSKVNNLKSKVATIERRLASWALISRSPRRPTSPRPSLRRFSLHQNDEVKLWAHDMAAIRAPRTATACVWWSTTRSLAQTSSKHRSPWAPVRCSRASSPSGVRLSRLMTSATSSSSARASPIRPRRSSRRRTRSFSCITTASGARPTWASIPATSLPRISRLPEYPDYDMSKLAELFPPEKGLPDQPAGPGANLPAVDPRRRVAPPTGPVAPPRGTRRPLIPTRTRTCRGSL